MYVNNKLSFDKESIVIAIHWQSKALTNLVMLLAVHFIPEIEILMGLNKSSFEILIMKNTSQEAGTQCANWDMIIHRL